MSSALSNNLIGLSLLSGSNNLSVLSGAIDVESVAVRVAKAAFTLPATTPPWKQTTGTTSESAQVAAIKRLATIIDKPATGTDALPDDVQTSFIAYKALDRLRVLAETAAQATTGSGERTRLDALFAKGMDDLRGFLAQAPSDQLDLSFGIPTRRAESVGVPVQNAFRSVGAGVASARDVPLAGLTGSEQFTLTLSKYGVSDQVHVDLAQSAQPPTIDSVASAINAAIAAVPLRNPDGSVVVDANGQTQPRWLVRFVPDKSTNKWGFALDNPAQEQVAMAQDNAPDALMVATGQTALDAPATVKLLRFDDPAGAIAQKTLGSIAGYDRLATERAKLAAPTVKAVAAVTLSQPHVDAATSADAIVTAPDGSSYVVGTTTGELDANRPAGSRDLTLTKLDSEGRVLWQRMLGAAGDASGAAVSLAANGDVLVAGTVTGAFDGQASDGDMLVSRYDAAGEEKFATLVRAVGADQASAITSGPDGSIYVGGRAASNNGDAFIARLDATGHLVERRIINSGGSDGVRALAVGADNSLIALTNENGAAVVRKLDGAALGSDLGSLSLGMADARALAVDTSGAIAVGGATLGALSGTQINGLSGARDGFVARIDAGFSGAAVSYIGTGGSDEVDSLTFMNGRIYAGGRTTGALSGARKGAVDGFVVALDSASGAQLSAHQFGQTAQRTEPVRISAATGGASALGALGLARGVLTPLDSGSLVAQSSLRANDSFSVRLNDGALKKISITASDTMTTLADKLRKAIGSNAAVTTPTVNGKRVLRIEAKAGGDVELIAGAEGTDALSKLGLSPTRLTVPTITGPRDPKVRPGGTYGLALSDALSLADPKNATIAVKQIKDAISTSQTAYRSLYWDDAKAALVNSAVGGPVSPYQARQVARYQDALTRISAITGITG